MANNTQESPKYRLITVADRKLIQCAEFPTYQEAFDAMVSKVSRALIESKATDQETWEDSEPDILQKIQDEGCYEESDFGISKIAAWYNGENWPRFRHWDWYIDGQPIPEKLDIRIKPKPKMEPKMTVLQDVPVGATFTVWGHKFTVLRHKGIATLVLAAEFAAAMPFRKREDEFSVAPNDFRDSSIQKFLDGPYMDGLISAGAKSSDFQPFHMDLKSPDGQREYGYNAAFAGLLTLEQYSEFWRTIPLLKSDGWWLATPYKTPNLSAYSRSNDGWWLAFYVSPGGYWSTDYCTDANSVRPVLSLNPELLVQYKRESD